MQEGLNFIQFFGQSKNAFSTYIELNIIINY
jgi:hypothetical protein